MANYMKKVEKARARLLQPGERLLGAAMIQPKGALKKQSIGGGLGGVLGAVLAQKLVSRAEPSAGMAAGVPARQAIAALTDQRFVLVGLGSVTGRAKQVVASWPSSAVTGIGYVKHGKLVSVLGISFLDGSSVEVECVRAGAAASVIDAFTARHAVPAR